ncbi:hypothetical protein like AT1G66910 [Hibiscus trionum]|uniref:Protein kinase domain-containing protein n=1 Tax=Hibiscus trionum TaxID=183268 RepID=A0A9W7HDF4_HIBTR|nr:hypothetical protein like AT1G66910 [Hibiscus trionum]
MLRLLVALILMVKEGGAAASSEICKVAECKRHGPPVRFPFWLQHRQSNHCGYPDSSFQLSCSENKQTLLHLPRSVKMVVQSIDYQKQEIRLSHPDTCHYIQLLSLNLSASPFQFLDSRDMENLILFNCSSVRDDTCPDKALPSDYKYNVDLINCSKWVDLPGVPYALTILDSFNLRWSKPMCIECEAQRGSCRLKNNGSTPSQTECYDIPKPKRSTQAAAGLSTKLKLIIAGVIVASFFLVLIVIGLYYVYHHEKRKKENQGKIEKFLEDYRSLKPSRYSFADIKRITYDFKDKLGQGGYGTVFKGRLSNDVSVAVKILNVFKGNGEEFVNEVGSMSRIHHVNVARLVGFCADGYNRALVYEYLPNESLEKFIFAANGTHVLGWDKLQEIALGIAKGIEYLHQGCEQRILHFDIKPHNILLDQNFNPKISDFGLAKLCSKEQSAVSMTAARGTMGYIAPEVLSRNFGNVSYKSDVYSFGMLLLEMVGGRKNIDVTVENMSQVYFPEWAYNHLDNGEEIGLRIENESHSEMARKLTIVGLWCIQWYPVDRPSMKVVIQMLEGEADSLTKPPNPFASADHMKMSASNYKKPIDIELAVIAE